LAQAAAQWASASNDSASDAPREEDGHQRDTSSTDASKLLSLHVTQLSFEATDYDIRTAFVKQGCAVTSVRLVYDQDGTHKTFRGVAFVDVQDEDSYKKALKLDRSYLQGRRINVRPTKTKTELANIVQRTKDLVAEKIRKERDGEKNAEKKKHDKKRKKDTKDVGNSKRQKDSKGKHNSPDAAAATAAAAREHKDAKSPGKDGCTQKLTKKERNRRAAIIMQRKRGKR
jgi:RNA recognition motif-containing protein